MPQGNRWPGKGSAKSWSSTSSSIMNKLMQGNNTTRIPSRWLIGCSTPSRKCLIQLTRDRVLEMMTQITRGNTTDQKSSTWNYTINDQPVWLSSRTSNKEAVLHQMQNIADETSHKKGPTNYDVLPSTPHDTDPLRCKLGYHSEMALKHQNSVSYVKSTISSWGLATSTTSLTRRTGNRGTNVRERQLTYTQK